eukprot:scaffold71367_cov21-Tisochrysis_lutea.AAC.1
MHSVELCGSLVFHFSPPMLRPWHSCPHPSLQAGYLEKALEISNWAMSTGLEFNSETYRELMETIEVAQIWDQKALKGIRTGDFLEVPIHQRILERFGIRELGYTLTIACLNRVPGQATFFRGIHKYMLCNGCACSCAMSIEISACAQLRLCGVFQNILGSGCSGCFHPSVFSTLPSHPYIAPCEVQVRAPKS